MRLKNKPKELSNRIRSSEFWNYKFRITNTRHKFIEAEIILH